MARCFIGLMIPENSKMQVEKLKEELKNIGVEGKFVEKENLHINLSFLGEKNDDETKLIMKELGLTASSMQKFDVTICGLKLIPNENFVRVIANDVRDENKKIEEMIEKITKNIGGDSKPPHLTLCRVKNIRDKRKLGEKVELYKNACFAGFTFDRIQLIKSELSRSGPLYSVIHESPLS